MKKKILVFVALVAFAVVGITTAQATKKINPECPNGCVGGNEGCYCYDYYPYYSKANWG